MARKGECIFQCRLPFTPGYEFVGEVVDHHADPAPPWLVAGARVAACLTRMGGYREYANLPVRLLAPVPDGLDTLAAAALPLDYLTALSLLTATAEPALATPCSSTARPAAWATRCANSALTGA
ncbi:hypothetical protein ABGB18_34710 [Nonomuraea sp. B12E4]|uniref:alcohol dehydrogenase catalytic domain-containing protein n=1 Tax=Nonomuraea sp. B12E4 TaxID=3153564 RepID=UPI00325E1E09